MTSHILKCTTCVAALLLPAAPVAAQSIAASAMQPQDASTQLEEIVVTGERYERSLQATTTSVASDRLQDSRSDRALPIPDASSSVASTVAIASVGWPRMSTNCWIVATSMNRKASPRLAK